MLYYKTTPIAIFSQSVPLVFDFALQITRMQLRAIAHATVLLATRSHRRQHWEITEWALSCGSLLRINYTDTCSPHPRVYICEKICVLMPQESPSVCSGSVGRRPPSRVHPLVARQITINTTVAWPNEQERVNAFHFELLSNPRGLFANALCLRSE